MKRRNKRHLRSRRTVRIGRDKKFLRKINRFIVGINRLQNSISGIIEAMLHQMNMIVRMYKR